MRRKKVLRSWLLTYMCILFIPVCISVIVNVQTRKTIEDEVIRSNSAMLMQVQTILDNQIRDMQLLGMQLQLNKDIQSLMYAKGINSSLRLKSIALLKQFEVYSIANSMIEDFYIYFPTIQRGLTSKTLLTADMLYDKYYSNAGMTYEEWLGSIQHKNSGRFVRIAAERQEDSVTGSLAYVITLMTDTEKQPLGSLVIFLNESRLQELLNGVQLVGNGSLAIMNPEGQILISNRPEQPMPELAYDSLPGLSGSLPLQWNGQKVMISYVTSDITGWKYVSVLPSHVYMYKVNEIRQYTTIGIVLCLIIGGVLAVIFARRNYSPVGKMMEFVSRKLSDAVPSNRNEFQVIESALTRSFDEKEAADQKLATKQEALRSGMLMQLAKGQLKGEALEAALEDQRIHFESDRFALALFQIEEPEPSRDAALAMLANRIEKAINWQYAGYLFEIDGRIACLINESGPGADSAEGTILGALQQIHEEIAEKGGISCTTALSDIHQDLAGIPQCYREAVEAIEYKMILDSNKLISYDDIRRPKQDLYYPLHLEQQLVNCIKVGDDRKATEIVEHIFEANFANGTLSMTLCKCLMFDFISTMVKSIREIDFDDLISDQTSHVQRLLESKSMKQMKAELIALITEICVHVDQNKRSHNVVLKEQIIAYVEQNYWNAELNVSSISDHFQMNATYLSRFMKEHSGEGLLDHINRTRINRAKVILQSQNTSIGELALQVGFSNSNSFIRLFKKYEGVTPGQLRQEL